MKDKRKTLNILKLQLSPSNQYDDATPAQDRYKNRSKCPRQNQNPV